jgi:hypothetical protein
MIRVKRLSRLALPSLNNEVEVEEDVLERKHQPYAQPYPQPRQLVHSSPHPHRPVGSSRSAADREVLLRRRYRTGSRF